MSTTRLVSLVLLCSATVVRAEPFEVVLPPIPPGTPHSQPTIGVYHPRVSGTVAVAYGHQYELYLSDLTANVPLIIDVGHENSSPDVQGDLIVWQRRYEIWAAWLPQLQPFLWPMPGRAVSPSIQGDAVIYQDWDTRAWLSAPLPEAPDGLSSAYVPAEYNVWKTSHNQLLAEPVGVPEPNAWMLAIAGLLLGLSSRQGFSSGSRSGR
jgi:hypothetical protein